MKSYVVWVGLLVAASQLGGCGPSEEEVAQWAEEKRIECRDKICHGDVTPSIDTATDTLLKLNGQWYVGPREYFSSVGRAEFEWWDHKPASSYVRRPPEMQALAVDGKGYDFSIEIFLRSRSSRPVARSTYQLLMQEDAQGRVVDRRHLTPDLDAWVTVNGPIRETWYVAKNLTDPSGDPPVVACRGDDPAVGRCTMGFLWRPDVSATMRFRATHGPDWPAIYSETIRVLNLLKEV